MADRSHVRMLDEAAEFVRDLHRFRLQVEAGSSLGLGS